MANSCLSVSKFRRRNYYSIHFDEVLYFQISNKCCRVSVHKEYVELYLHSPIRLHGVVLSLNKVQGQLCLSLPFTFTREMT